MTSLTEPRAPGFRDMAPAALIGPISAAALFGVLFLSWQAAQVAAVAAVATVLLVAWPLIFWMLDNGKTGPVSRTVIGIVCALVPFIGAVLSGMFGLYARSNDSNYVRWVLDHGAPVPYFGTIPWVRFAAILAIASVCGIVTIWTTARRKSA
jgi:hypothetical protein